MRRLKVSIHPTWENIKVLLNRCSSLAAIKVMDIFQRTGIINHFTRSRSPEEIFHLLNFFNLEKHFYLLFDLLHYKGLLKREGEFYQLTHNYKIVLNKLREEVSNAPAELIQPIEAFLDSHIPIYLSILNGEHGKIDHYAFYDAFDRLYSTEFMLSIMEAYYTTIFNSLRELKDKKPIHVINWGVGSGYEALLLADMLGSRIKVISVEPNGTLERAHVIQDFYGLYNVQFIEEKDFDPKEWEGIIDLFIGRTQILRAIKEKIQNILITLSSQGYFTTLLCTELSKAFNWILSIYSQFELVPDKDHFIAILKHYGLGKVKYLGFDNDLIALQKV